MKKILPALVLFSLLTVLLTPAVASANGPVEECQLKHDLSEIDAACAKGATVDETATKAWGMCCMLDAVYTATDWIFVVLMAFVAIMIIWGGVTLVTAGGAPEKVTSGRNYIVYALIGFAIALLAKALPAIVRALLGM